MVYISTLEEWQKQSALLLQARPSTTRVTTKYNIPNLSTKRYAPSVKKEDSENKESAETQARAPRAWITLKTYDPVSGVTLKFKTDRAQDIGRTIAGLGTLGRHMAALPPKAEVKDVIEAAETAPANPDTTAVVGDTKNTQASGTSKKKKKGKK